MASPWTAQKRPLLYNSRMDLVVYLFYESDAVLHVTVLPGQVRNGVYHVPNEWYPSITGVCPENVHDDQYYHMKKSMYDYACAYNFRLLGAERWHWIVNWSFPVYTLPKKAFEDLPYIDNNTKFVASEEVDFVNEVQPKDINDLLCMHRPHSFAYFSRLIFCPLSLTIYGTIDERKDVDQDTWETWQPLHLSQTFVDDTRTQPHVHNS